MRECYLFVQPFYNIKYEPTISKANFSSVDSRNREISVLGR